jgi:hypothetical protein
MIKIELIHNKEILKILKSLLKTDALFGFTSLVVSEGYGPLKGEFKEDHLGDEQYYSIVLLEKESEADNLVSILREKAPSNKFLAMKSSVEKIK